MISQDSPTQAAIAATRFGLGPRPGELRIIGSDPRGWLREQVRKPQPLPVTVQGLVPGELILAQFQQQQEQRRLQRRQSKQNPAGAEAFVASVRSVLLPHYLQQAAARIRTAIRTAAPFHERLVQFWTNHFAVSVDKLVCLGVAGALENETVRPHVNGRFVDLLLAVERHPAMIAYLDNQYSVGPNSALANAARRRTNLERRIDINENLAREILELHTLGVNGGYTQADVTTFAKVLTGWSIGGGRGPLAGGTPGQFHFRDNLHEPGPQTLLGRTYRQSGREQASAVFADLAAQPATARFLAAKLTRHFVADEPPPECVERLTAAYLANDGSLPAVYAALIDFPGAWTPAPAKHKTPQDFVYSAYRALELEPKDDRMLLAPFELLGQRPYSPGSPAGWPDTARDWDGADALMKRIEWTVALSDRVSAGRAPLEVAAQSLGTLVNEHTLDAIRRAASGAQGLALLLLSPEFQRR